MKRQPRILAGTALGLLMASAPLGAFPLQGSAAFGPMQGSATPLILAQDAPAEDGQQSDQEQRRKKKREQQQQTEQAPAAEQAAPAEEQQPRRKKRDQQQQSEQAPAAEQAAPAEEQQPRRKKRDQQQQTEQAPAEQPAGEAQPANDNQDVKPGRKHKQDQRKEAPAVTPEAAPTPKQAPAAGEAPATEAEQPLDRTRKNGRKPVEEQPANGEQPATGEQPANGEKPATGELPANGNKVAPAQGENPVQGEAPADPNAAPILDSQKDAERKEGGRRRDKNGQQQNDAQGSQQGGNEANKPVAAPVDQGPPPADDKAAQQEIKREKFVPVTEEKGKRLDRAPDENIRDRRRPKGVDVLKEIGDRVIIQLGDQTIVQSNDGSRLNRGAKDVYYEDLPQGRTRETVQRGNGVEIVTIRNRYGDVVRRSRITPDGREYVLSYVDERDYQDEGDWRDPGDDLPPMRLTIPRRQYILDSEEVESPDDYYEFLEQPPVEKVQRLYSIDEVKRSARVRDIARRIDLDTLNFEFGSATISDTEVQKLEGVASAMEKLLKKNPAETFLIEGHTDAVGTPEANLALSDRRAESVAEALTNAFGIPPENLTTQGYGEEYLKVNTSGPNRENRRVGIRRITSLVAPVASNE
ncbi:OmpA family protein [Mesorhizobium sp. ES1-1]|uniref:OmpA family protein n=1 Tax=Mesorhizobium sp. ES1-1 TaxID=2876629 RepID=UPI001CC9B8EC|nr:OmpA family protein [Mesorhizobium sp. ES1-1]MBZ9676154.1 OmpA family protein [Mesorhizobium sp. ES1-1]